MKAVCKFRVVSVEVTRGHTAEGDREDIGLMPQYDADDPEDTKFSAATPSGNMQFSLSNPKLMGHFRPGQLYYVSLTPAAEPETGAGEPPEAEGA